MKSFHSIRRTRVLRWGLVLLGITTASALLASKAAGQIAATDGRYQYIVHWNGTPIECDSGVATFPLPYLQGRDGWYGGQLRATGQGALCREVPPPDEVFRLTWLPSFQSTVMVRIEKRSSAYAMLAVRLSGAAGYEPGRPERDTTISLTAQDWETWLGLMAEARFWEASTTETDSAIGPDGEPVALTNLDGAQWLLEARRGNQYHAVDRWSPHAEPYMAFRKACEWLLKRSGLADSTAVAEY